eukprot:jgi/Bigna1/142990/aug1.74_g17698
MGQLKRHKVGDPVWLHRDEDRKGHRVAPHFALKKTGPVLITASIGDSNACRVEDPETSHRNVVHAKHLSPFGTFTASPEAAVPPQDEASSSESDQDLFDDSSGDEEEEDDADISARNVQMHTRTRKAPDRGAFVSH